MLGNIKKGNTNIRWLDPGEKRLRLSQKVIKPRQAALDSLLEQASSEPPCKHIPARFPRAELLFCIWLKPVLFPAQSHLKHRASVAPSIKQSIPHSPKDWGQSFFSFRGVGWSQGQLTALFSQPAALWYTMSRMLRVWWTVLLYPYKQQLEENPSVPLVASGCQGCHSDYYHHNY